MIITWLLILTYSVFLLPQPEKTSNEKSFENDIFFPPEIPLDRSTRGETPWPMHLANPQHTSYSTATGPVTDDVLWYGSTGGYTYGSPAVANGRVFIGGGDGMNAFYTDNGTLTWRTPIYDPVPGSVGPFGVTSSPAYSNGYVYFGGDGIYCLYENNGTVKWFIDTPDQNWGDGTPTVVNGKVFIAGSDRKLYAIDQITGSINWTFQTLSSGADNWGLYAAPAVAYGQVYLAACDGYLYQINESQPISTATANHTFRMAYASYSSPVVVDDRVYVGCGYDEGQLSVDNRFYCLNATDLSLIWEFYPGYETSFFSSAGYHNGRIYIGSMDGYLYCLDATESGPSPTVYWQYNFGKETWSSPAITSDRLYIGSKNNYVYCFNLSQIPGSEAYLWRSDTGGDVDSSPAVTDNKVYIGSQGIGGRIYCLGSSIEPPNDNYTILKKGWNLVSVPFVQQDNNMASVLSSINGLYDAVEWYNISASSDHWELYKIGKPFGNDLSQLNEKMGFWIHITQPGDTLFVYNGSKPTSNQTITLYPGWNLVGYPSLKKYNRTSGLNNLTFDTHVDSVWTYNASIPKWEELTSSDFFEPGRGYWIHAKKKCEWEVPL